LAGKAGQGNTGSSQEAKGLPRELVRSVAKAVATGLHSDYQSALEELTEAVNQGPRNRKQYQLRATRRTAPEPPGILSRLIDVKNLATTIILFSIVVLKVLAVVNFNSTTALALVEAAGPIPVVIGSVIGSLYALLPLTTIVMMLAISGYIVRHDMHWLELDRDVLQGIGVLLLALFTIQVFTIPAGALLVILINFVFIIYIPLFSGSRRRRSNSSGSVRPDRSRRSSLETLLALHGRKAITVQFYLVLAVSIIALTPSLIGSSMWLPAERVSLQGQPAVIAYVLDDDGDWSSLLRDSDRIILRVTTKSITHRDICRVIGNTKVRFRSGESLYQLINHGRGQPVKGRLLRC
jgi:hypothetical protein